MAYERLETIRGLQGVTGVVVSDGDGIVKWSKIEGDPERMAAVAVFLRDTMLQAGKVVDQGGLRRVLVTGEGLRILVVPWNNEVLGITVAPDASVAILEDQLRGMLS